MTQLCTLVTLFALLTQGLTSALVKCSLWRARCKQTLTSGQTGSPPSEWNWPSPPSSSQSSVFCRSSASFRSVVGISSFSTTGKDKSVNKGAYQRKVCAFRGREGPSVFCWSSLFTPHHGNAKTPKHRSLMKCNLPALQNPSCFGLKQKIYNTVWFKIYWNGPKLFKSCFLTQKVRLVCSSGIWFCFEWNCAASQIASHFWSSKRWIPSFTHRARKRKVTSARRSAKKMETSVAKEGGCSGWSRSRQMMEFFSIFRIATRHVTHRASCVDEGDPFLLQRVLTRSRFSREQTHRPKRASTAVSSLRWFCLGPRWISCRWIPASVAPVSAAANKGAYQRRSRAREQAGSTFCGVEGGVVCSGFFCFFCNFGIVMVFELICKRQMSPPPAGLRWWWQWQWWQQWWWCDDSDKWLSSLKTKRWKHLQQVAEQPPSFSPIACLENHMHSGSERIDFSGLE